jgi:hydroxymethylpyrimidine pyrophosphatase-like HAD family hydrolase
MLNPKIHSKAANKLRLGSSSDLAQIIKILVLPKINDLTSLRLCEGLSDLSVQPHSDGTFDLMPVGVDKTTGLRALGHALPVFAAFGNDANDLAMLRAARHSVCIGNHHDVQLVASQIIHSGPRQPERIARAINRLIQKAGAGILSHGVGQIMEAGR